MHNCREISKLVSQSMDKQLGWPQRLAVKFHLLICTHCRRFQHQTRFMRKAARRYTDHLQDHLDRKL